MSNSISDLQFPVQESTDLIFVTVTTAENQSFIIRWFLIPFLRPVLVNMREMEEYLESEACLDIDYTIVRPPGLATGPPSGLNQTVID